MENLTNNIGDYVQDNYIPKVTSNHYSDPLRRGGMISANPPVPDEYRDDPELWYAIQASMQFEEGNEKQAD